MANSCYFEMKIRGRRSDCEKWVDKMVSYDEDNHFYRIFSADVYDECEETLDGEPVYAVTMCGECAWSLESCCRASGYSGGKDLFAINTRDLNLVMEAYSSESGMGFQEHYLYNHGECIISDCVDYQSYYYDESEYISFEEFRREMGLTNTVRKSDIDENGDIYIGGFSSWEFSI